MSDASMPSNNEVEELLANLLGRDVSVAEGKAPKPGDAFCGVAGYRRDDGSLAAVVVCDVAFAAHAGCCLALVPAGTAEEMAKSGELSSGAEENAREVFNVLATGIARSDGPPLRLAEMSFGSDAPADEIAKLLGSSAGEIAVDIDGYGQGQIAVYLA